MRRFIGTTVLAVLLAAWPASAQYSGWSEYKPQSTLFTVGYQMSQPVGSFHDYISSSSFRGFTFDWRSMLKQNFSAGLRFNWNRYDQSESLVTTTNTTNNRTTSGPTYHYADQFAIQAVGHFYFDTGPSIFTPYLGVGLGGVWNSSYQQTIDLANAQNGFYFITTPELGLIINFAKGRTTAALNLSVLYNFTTAGFAGVSNASALTETIGVTVSY
ncbi:MAG TPA: hypothetical protein VG496_07770 [Myxococcales bacterium]|nr:hypothetical protein [Myxococcales bacterium]